MIFIPCCWERGEKTLKHTPSYALTRFSENEKQNIDQDMLLDMALRFNPEIICVGEMRSSEAYTAQESARTGHTVLTTIHSNSCESTYSRMRTLCKRKYDMDDEVLMDLVTEAFPIVVFTKQLENKKKRLMEIMECEITSDGKRHFNSLYRYEITENRVEGDTFIINGTHKKVSGIPAKPQYDRSIKLSEKKLWVAAYCRVSTELEEQESSYEAQVEYYTRKIEETDNWKMAGIYADDGKSATNTKKRDDFNAMIKDALEGKIDMILTKSVSRFARNTVDSLLTIRKLKEKNVPVVFEKEGVNTMDGTGEILITILSSLAQEESRNISENTRWGVVRRFENGKMIVNHNKFMGYTKNENGDLVIVPEEAEIVRLIFRLYLEGYSAKKITAYLEENGIKTATGQDKWHDSVIFKMLRNEKYMGDALLQKTYTVDFMTKKRVMNKGIVPQYYVEDDHEPIIPKELFYRVQEEMARRSAINKSAVTSKKNQKGKFS